MCILFFVPFGIQKKEEKKLKINMKGTCQKSRKKKKQKGIFKIFAHHQQIKQTTWCLS